MLFPVCLFILLITCTTNAAKLYDDIRSTRAGFFVLKPLDTNATGWQIAIDETVQQYRQFSYFYYYYLLY